MKKILIIVALIAITLLNGCAGFQNSNIEERLSENIPITSNEILDKGVIDLKGIIEVSKKITKKEYPSSDAVLVDDYEKVIYNADGTSERWDEVYEKSLTEKGKRENSTMSLHYTLPYSTIVLKKLEIIKPNGKVVPIDIEKQSKTIVNPSQMNSNIYNPNSKVINVNIPNLEINDIIHYISYRKTVKARVPNTWCDITVLEYTSPIKNYKIEVIAPKELPLEHILIKDSIKGSVKSKIIKYKDAISYSWEVKDIPRIFKEPSMPEYYTVTQRLLLSTTKDWETLSKWYWNLSKPRLDKITKEMEDKVKELIKDAKTREEKINNIFQFVSQKIRYMGITTEEEAPGYEPHDVDITFNNRHGVCRDKAALLVTMLRLAGFKAYPVLINNGPKKDIEIPNNFFNHAISCVENEDGSYTLMDSTDENTKDIFPAYLSDKSYLVAKPEGETLLTSDIISPKKNLMEITTTGEVNKKGDIIAETTLLFNGINDGVYRGYFLRNKQEKRKLLFQGKLKKILPGAELLEIEILPKDLSKMSIPLSVKLKYKAENCLITGEDTEVFPIPWLGTSFGMVNFILDSTGLEKRKYPLKTEIACGVKESLTLTLEKSYKNIKFPNYETIDNASIFWNKNLERSKNIISGDAKFLIRTVEFSAKEYLVLKKNLEDMEYNKRKQIILSK